MPGDRVVVIGAGIGGLACALSLALQGLDVTVLEKAPQAGGKMREIEVTGRPIDSGPTVFTMRWVFDALFDAAGTSLERELVLTKAEILARHAWDEGPGLDLFADQKRSAEAIGAFAGKSEAAGFRNFCAEAALIYRTLRHTFLDAPRPGPISLARRIGFTRPGALLAIRPFETMWRALGKHFQDPRLRQLFGRYATYCGSSPFAAPATLMLVAHVEQEGVWLVDGGMQRLADALQRVAAAHGVRFRFNETVCSISVDHGRASGVTLGSGERISADAVVSNADAAALAAGLFGAGVSRSSPPVRPSARTQSALTWSMLAHTKNFPLLRHNVFFSSDYRAEFDDVLARGRLPQSPTVYLCAQDRGAADGPAPQGQERLFMLVNAPPGGDGTQLTQEDINSCAARSFQRMQASGLIVDCQAGAMVTTTPADFERLFPATGGALYGRASHGWRASFLRPGSRTSLPGLYLAGGSVHPGAGVPMAALSGQLAARRLIADLALTSPYRRAAISGGTSTVSATTDSTRSR